jgi:choline dehydrogenase
LGTCYGTRENPLHTAWLKAAAQAGYGLTDDINGYRQEGFGAMDMTVDEGVRASAAHAYLRPIRHRPNLAVMTQAMAKRVIFDGHRAVGVEVVRDGNVHTFKATREVIVSAGPIQSPKLLKLSGVGPGAELQALGIPVVADRAGVGANLQDHLEVYFQMGCTQPITLYSVMNPLSKLWIGMRWLWNRTGLGATNHFETCGFIRSRAGVRYPDIQYHFLPMAVSYDGSSLASEHGFQAHVGPMRSKSRGSVTLRSTDPFEHPKIQFNYLTHPDDPIEFRAAIRLTRELFSQPAFKPFVSREIAPGIDVSSDEAIDAWVRAHVESAYHPSCSCKMGAVTDPLAVVDPQTRVIGVEGLRVVDSSIMPQITNGNLNAPTIMIAEKAADHIRQKPLLPPSSAPFYEAPNWQTAQR